MKEPVLRLKPGKEKSLERQHAWLFSGAIDRVEGTATEGELATVVDSSGKFMARGYLCTGSIAFKALTHRDEVIDELWFGSRISEAIAFRKSLGFATLVNSAYRLIHGEGDGLPGLIVDVYAHVAVVQPHSSFFELWSSVIGKVLVAEGYKNVLLKPMNKAEATVLAGEVPAQLTISENGYSLLVDVMEGQKTGLFIDQRDNRALVMRYANGRKVLNAFSYTGGFSVAALAGGAVSVLSVDSAAKALHLADENARLNGFETQHQSLRTDAITYLQKTSDTFDLAVIDPPAFAKHLSARRNAIAAYRRLNESAIARLSPGGVLFTFSCSQVIDAQLFSDIVVSASISTKRRLRIIHTLRQPADHPVSTFHPEGDYLKGLVAVVD